VKINNLEQIKQRIIERRKEDIPRGEVEALEWVLKEIEKIEEKDREVKALIELLKNEEVKELLSELYKDIWNEACVTPRTEETREFAIRLLPLNQRLNQILGFKD